MTRTTSHQQPWSKNIVYQSTESSPVPLDFKNPNDNLYKNLLALRIAQGIIFNENHHHRGNKYSIILSDPQHFKFTMILMFKERNNIARGIPPVQTAELKFKNSRYDLRVFFSVVSQLEVGLLRQRKKSARNKRNELPR